MGGRRKKIIKIAAEINVVEIKKKKERKNISIKPGGDSLKINKIDKPLA